MTEATPVHHAAVRVDQVKIAYLDRAKKTIRLIFLAGPDKDHNLEYDYSAADVDTRIRTGDAPIDAQIQGNKLVRLSFPPGLEPIQPVGVPVSQAKPAEPAKPPAAAPKEEPPKQEPKPFIPPADDGKWRIKLLKKEGSRALILKNNGQEEWFEIKDKAVEKIIRLKEGQLVKLRFEGTHTITDINPVDESGEYDKTAWGSGGGKGGGRPYDPEAEKRRQILIVRQSCLDRAVQLWIAVHAEHAGEIGTNQEQSITNLAEDFETWVLR